MKAIIEFFNTVAQQATFPQLAAGKVAELLLAAKQEIDSVQRTLSNQQQEIESLRAKGDAATSDETTEA